MQLIRFLSQSDHGQFLETERFATPFKQAADSSVSAELPPLASGGTEPCFPNRSDKAVIPWYPAPCFSQGTAGGKYLYGAASIPAVVWQFPASRHDCRSISAFPLPWIKQGACLAAIDPQTDTRLHEH